MEASKRLPVDAWLVSIANCGPFETNTFAVPEERPNSSLVQFFNNCPLTFYAWRKLRLQN